MNERATWQDKHIDKWTCSELQEWIRTLKLGYTNQQLVLTSIAEQDIVGEDFNSIAEEKDIQDQFPGINIIIASKLYFALLKINNTNNNNNPAVNSLNHRANRRAINQQSVHRRTFNQNLQQTEQKEQKEEYIIIENKYDDIQPNNLKKYYEKLIAKLKQQHANELITRDNNAIKELGKLKNGLQRWKDKYKTLKSSNETSTLKSSTQEKITEHEETIRNMHYIKTKSDEKLAKQAHDIIQLKKQQTETQAKYKELEIRQHNATKKHNKVIKEFERQKNELDLQNAQIKLNKFLDQYDKSLKEKDKILEKQARDIMEMNIIKQQQEVEITKLHEKIVKLNNEKLEINNKYLVTNRENKVIKKERENVRKNINESEENTKMLLKQMETLNTEKHKLLKQVQSIEHKHDKLQEQIIELNKWKDKYFDKNKQFIILRNEKLNVENKKNELIEIIKKLTHKLNKYESDIKQYKKENNNIQIIAAPCDILDDEDETDDDTKQEEDNFLLSDDELCKILQQDLENYIVDQRKNEKTRENRKENKVGKKKKKNMLVLNELRIFHENQSQILRNWDSSLKKNHFSTLFETLEEKLENKYDDIDCEKLAYNILFDIVIESYDLLHNEYNKIIHNEYMSPNVIDMVLMNISLFYDLMKREKLKTLKKRIVNIHKYINYTIDGVYKQIKNKHEDVDDEDKNELCQFIVNCCELIWSVLHYDFTVYPLNFILNKSDRKYNDKIHEKEGAYDGDSIEYCIFPAIMKDNKHQTKIWVICDDDE